MTGATKESAVSFRQPLLVKKAANDATAFIVYVLALFALLILYILKLFKFNYQFLEWNYYLFISVLYFAKYFQQPKYCSALTFKAGARVFASTAFSS